MVNSYANDVVSGKIISCELVRLACQRHLKDLEELDDYYFDQDDAEFFTDMFPTVLRHFKGKHSGKPFELEPWQMFIIGCLFGWKKTSTHTRRFQTAYIELGKKNGKTALAAAASIVMLVLDGEASAEIYYAATRREQAKICFDAAKAMCEKSVLYGDHIETFTNSITMPETYSKAVPLSKEKDAVEGVNPHCVVIDEYHLHKTSELRNNLYTAMVSRTQPLMITITTAGFNKDLPCYDLRRTSIDILKGRKKDESAFSIIYTLDDDDDWRDENCWVKANPNIGVSVEMDNLRQAFVKAQNEGGTEEVSFRTKHMNSWVDSADTWIPDDEWMACDFGEEDVSGLEGYGGLDLASTKDVTALVIVFPKPDGSYATRRYYWLPEEAVQKVSKMDNEYPYFQWARDGKIIQTPGNVTDYDFIRKFITGYHIVDGKVEYDDDNLMEELNIHSIAYDRWNSLDLVVRLSNDGVTMSPFGQGFASMSAPTKELERLIRTKRINHEGDPVLRWMAGNVYMKMDPAGNIKPDKDKSQKKIDGIVATIMALGETMTFAKEDNSNQLSDDFEFGFL